MTKIKLLLIAVLVVGCDQRLPYECEPYVLVNYPRCWLKGTELVIVGHVPICVCPGKPLPRTVP